VPASSEIAIQQSSQQSQIREMIRGVNEYGGKFESKIEDRRPDGSVYRTTTNTYYPPSKR